MDETARRQKTQGRAHAQSCKLIPVLLLNVLLYRRRFSPHKYLVVSLVTVGISMFMFFGPKKVKGAGGEDSVWGLGLLLVKYVFSFTACHPRLCLFPVSILLGSHSYSPMLYPSYPVELDLVQARLRSIHRPSLQQC